MRSFWDQLPKPFFCLAPMADVTDAAFRRIIAKYGKPDVMFTEFVSADGLCHPKGREKLLPSLLYSEAERPIVAQLFTTNPDKMEKAAGIIQELGFDGLDINLGCPDRAVEKQGAGAALMKNPKLAQAIIYAARAGAPQLPVSVKTRLGYSCDELNTWLPTLLETNLTAITIHARTRQEMSKVPAHWEALERAVKIRGQLKNQTLIIGNGDIADLAAARTRAEDTGVDGIMLGRAIFGNPWLFGENQNAIICSRPTRGSRDQSHSGFPITKIKGETFDPQDLALRKRLRVLVEHTKLFEKLLGEVKSFSIMKKHYKAYVVGCPPDRTVVRVGSDASELRQELMRATTGAMVGEIVDKYLATMLQ